MVPEAEGLGQVTIDTKALRAALESEPGSVSVRLTKTLVDDLCDELEAAQAALENIHAMVGRRGSCIGAKAIVACVTDSILSMRNAYDEADSIRALADKPPGVVCVARDDLVRIRRNVAWAINGEERCCDTDILALLEAVLK